MYKTLGLFILTLMFVAAGGVGVLAQSPYGDQIGLTMGASEQQGVYCEVNGVRLFAKSAEDCQTASGEVTHVINTKVTPVAEPVNNPDQEPEIQREKNKEPEAQ